MSIIDATTDRDESAIAADIDALKMICEAMENTQPRMRQAALQFAWNKYVIPLTRSSRKHETS